MGDVQLRGGRAVAAILGATLEEISEKGYPALTIESVAERAGVDKTTVYRRWPTKADLTLAALTQAGDEIFADPDTGALAEDLLVIPRRSPRCSRAAADARSTSSWFKRRSRAVPCACPT